VVDLPDMTSDRGREQRAIHCYWRGKGSVMSAGGRGHERGDHAAGGREMYDTSQATVIERLTRLERERHWWRVLGSIAVALFAIVGLMGALGRQDVEGPQEVRARAFVLVDREGKPRMDLRVALNDSTHLVLMDREGLARLSLNVLSQGGADVVLRDQQGQPRAALSVVPDGRPGLSLYDTAGTTRASLGVFPEDKAILVLYAPRGQVHWFTP
jgi:hypothetical protein